MNKVIIFLMMSSMVGSVMLAQAATYSPPGINRPLAEEGWNGTFTLNKFDQRLGTLTDIQFNFVQEFRGISQAENKNSNPQDINLNLQASLSLSDKYGDALDSETQTFKEVFHAAAYDSQKDFTGASGVTYDTGIIYLSQTLESTDPATLATYSSPTGAAFTFNAKETDTSSFTGTGNVAVEFTTYSGGTAQLIYTYTSAVPEPETFATLLAGLCLMAFTLHARKQS